MTVLVVAEHDNHSLKSATLSTVTAAAQISMFLDGQIHVLVVGHQAQAVAEQAARIDGVSKVLVADAPHLGQGLVENVAAQVVAVAESYSHILFAATAAGKDAGPRVAALLDVAKLSEITRVIAADTFEHPIYAGNAVATVQCLDGRKGLTVRSTGFDAAPGGGSASLERVQVVPDSGQSMFIESEIARNDRPELTSARIVVSGGRALGSAEKFNEVITPLADKLGAARGASRAAVDAGYAANDLQMGQTGRRSFTWPPGFSADRPRSEERRVRERVSVLV